MTEFNLVTEEQLRPVLDLIMGQSWPIPETETPRIITELGWEQQSRRVARSTLPVSLNIATFGNLKGELARILFAITDTLPDQSDENKKVVASVFPRMANMVSSCLGFQPTRPRPWGLPGLSWDLSDGRQVNLTQGDNVIDLEIWSKRNADIERGEIRQGVDPARTHEEMW